MSGIWCNKKRRETRSEYNVASECVTATVRYERCARDSGAAATRAMVAPPPTLDDALRIASSASSSVRRSAAPPPEPHCWQFTLGNLQNAPGIKGCLARFATLGAAQHACLHSTYFRWCGGVVKDGGRLCAEGISQFELRKGGANSGTVPVWLLQRGRAPRNGTNCRASEPRRLPAAPKRSWESGVQWDPEPLPWGWWLPASNTILDLGRGSPSPDDYCRQPAEYVQMRDFGRTNNNLLSWAHALELVAPIQPPVALVLAPDFETVTAPWFDWRAATQGWACVVSKAEVPPNATVRVLDPPSVFFLQQQASGALFVSSALAQLLLRPVPALRTAVRDFEARHPDGYDGVHLRSFEQREGDKCANWLTPAAVQCQTVRAHDMPDNRDVSGVDLCLMSDAYLRAALTLGQRADGVAHGGVSNSTVSNAADASVSPRSLPLLVAHDGHVIADRLSSLRSNFGAVESAKLNGETWRGPGTLFIDMLLLMRARVFVGNPGSTVSQNVAAVRSLLKPPGTTNMRLCSEALQGADKFHERQRREAQHAAAQVSKSAKRAQQEQRRERAANASDLPTLAPHSPASPPPAATELASATAGSAMREAALKAARAPTHNTDGRHSTPRGVTPSRLPPRSAAATPRQQRTGGGLSTTNVRAGKLR